MGMTTDLQSPPQPGSGERWALFLDIDGTLVGFDADPAQVVLDAALLELLERVGRRTGGALGILSGRTLADVDALMRPLRLPAGALHGHELRDATGATAVRRPSPGVAAEVEARMRDAEAALEGVVLERKSGVGFVLHFRGASHQARAAAQAAESIALASRGEYEVQHGDCVAELKPSGSSKGLALRRLMEQAPFRGRRPVVVGDDLTDEHAFAAAGGLGGFGIVVGSRVPTAARYRLPGPAAVRAWLAQLADPSP